MTEIATKTVSVARYTDVDVAMPDGTALPVRIRAFTRPELTEFMKGFSRIERPDAARAIYRKAGEEGVSMATVRARRLEEMTPEQADAQRALEAADVEHQLAFCAAQVATFVRVQPGVTLNAEAEDGTIRQVSTGQELAELYAGDPEALAILARAIAEENTLGLEKKRRSRLRFASTPSSGHSSPANPPGATPAATAPSAEPSPVSASSVAASEDQAWNLSGETT